jgi:hypothetical protein
MAVLLPALLLAQRRQQILQNVNFHTRTATFVETLLTL